MNFYYISWKLEVRAVQTGVTTCISPNILQNKYLLSTKSWKIGLATVEIEPCSFSFFWCPFFCFRHRRCETSSIAMATSKKRLRKHIAKSVFFFARTGTPRGGHYSAVRATPRRSRRGGARGPRPADGRGASRNRRGGRYAGQGRARVG